MNFLDMGAHTDGEKFFTNSNDQNICYQSWVPSQNSTVTKAVFILHGVGEHYRAYDTVIRGLLEKKFLVCAHDHIGHGKSEGDRVHINSFDRYVMDVVQHVDIIKKKYPNIVCYVLGHSMGGAVALKTALEHPTLFAGMALIAPAIKPDPVTITTCQKIMLSTVSVFFPQMEVSTIDPKLLCRDKAVVDRYVNDPLTWHGGLKARFLVCMLNTMDEIVNRAGEVTWPILLIHGSEDQICMPEGSQILYDKATSNNKQIKMFPGAYHQVHKEIDGQGEQVINLASDWLVNL